MFHKRTGFPDVDEIVLCTVTNVQYNSVFVTLDEYENKSGMIHISEVSAGRIRNIREYVQEGRKVTCKVLHIDKERGHIDLSLRRVGEGQKREKNMVLKQEQKAESLVEHLAKEHKQNPQEFYDKVAKPILEHYEYLFMAFEDIAKGEFNLSETTLDAKTAKMVEDAVRERIKPKQVQIEGVLTITTYQENGIAKVKEALTKARDAAQPAEIHYLGSGKYRIIVTAEEFKQAEKQIKSATDIVEKSFKNDAAAEIHFERVEAK